MQMSGMKRPVFCTATMLVVLILLKVEWVRRGEALLALLLIWHTSTTTRSSILDSPVPSKVGAVKTVCKSGSQSEFPRQSLPEFNSEPKHVTNLLHLGE